MSQKRLLRRVAIGVAVLAVVGAGVYTALVRGVFDGAILTTAALGLLFTILQRFPERPQLDVAWMVDGHRRHRVVVGEGARVRPLAIDDIVDDEQRRALETPPSRRPPSPLDALARARPRTFEPSDEERTKFKERVERYGTELRAWLAGKDARRRAEQQELVAAHVSLRNDGAAAAENVRIRLLFPGEHFAALDERDDDEAGPPTRPTWSEFGTAVPFNLRPVFPEPPGQARGGLRGPTYSREQHALVVEYVSSHLSAGLSDQSGYPMELQGDGVGEFDVRWEVYADALRGRVAGRSPSRWHRLPSTASQFGRSLSSGRDWEDDEDDD